MELVFKFWKLCGVLHIAQQQSLLYLKQYWTISNDIVHVNNCGLKYLQPNGRERNHSSLPYGPLTIKSNKHKFSVLITSFVCLTPSRHTFSNGLPTTYVSWTAIMKGPLIFMAYWKCASNRSKLAPNQSNLNCKAAILGEFCKSSKTCYRFFSSHQQDHPYIITLHNRNLKIYLASHWIFILCTAL